ncbi:NUDIX hydrolase [Salmonella enterica]|nr:NUDIX hydrolase [Salmonella enterica]
MRKDGVYVKPHQTKTQKEAPEATKPASHYHAQPNEQGKRVKVQKPTLASAPSTWNNAEAIATFTPQGDHPRRIGKVPFTGWTAQPKTKAGWNYVPGINWHLDEKPLVVAPGKHPGAGVIIEEDDGRVWLVTPTNSYGGYRNTFPKGTCEEGLSYQANAIKEAWEEAGLHVEITGILGDFERTTSTARMYTARRLGGNPVDMGWESQAVRLVPKNRLLELLNMEPDQDVLKAWLTRKKD